MSKPAIIIDSDKEEIAQLMNKWKKVKNVGDGILSFGSAGFVGSVLSPFDFEGPVVEIVTAVITVCGFIVKKIGENKIEELEGRTAEWSEEDKEILREILKKMQEAAEERKSKKQLK